MTKITRYVDIGNGFTADLGQQFDENPITIREDIKYFICVDLELRGNKQSNIFILPCFLIQTKNPSLIQNIKTSELVVKMI